MTREELRVFLGKFNCGCGDPPMAVRTLTRVLLMFEEKDPATDYRKAWTQAEPMFKDEGAFWLFLYLLDSTGVLEHGTSVRCSWLSRDGEAVLEALRREEALDDFETLMARDTCSHGYAIDEFEASGHSCAQATEEAFRAALGDNNIAMIKSARETWRNDGAEGETVHRLCTLAEDLAKELAGTR